MTREDYPCRQDRTVAARAWAREMYERDMAYGIFAALRDGLYSWLDEPTVPAGFYGQDHE